MRPEKFAPFVDARDGKLAAVMRLFSQLSVSVVLLVAHANYARLTRTLRGDGCRYASYGASVSLAGGDPPLYICTRYITRGYA